MRCSDINMKIVGEISTVEEAREIKFIAEISMIGNIARTLALEIKK